MTFKLFGKDVSASKTFKQVGKTAAGTAGGIGAAWAATKLADFAKQSIGAMDNLGKQTLTLQRYMGGTTEDASRLAHAFTMTGTDTKLASVGLGIFSKNLVAAKDQQRAFKAGSEEAAASHKKFTGNLGKNAQAFADLGITIRDSNGDMLPMKDLLMSTAGVFAKMPAGPTRTAAAMKLFGKSGASLLPFLSKGADGVKELMEESDKLGTTLSGKDTDAVKKNTAEKRRMGEAIKGIQVTIGRHLMPAISALVTFLSEKVIPVVAKVVGWLKDHKDIVVILAGVLVPIIAGFKAWTVVMGIFNAVMAANPIVLIILAIVGLVALLVMAYKKFDWFRKFVDGAWQGIQKVIKAVVDWFMTNAWPILKRVIEFIVAYYKMLWKVVSAVFRWIWGAVSNFVSFFRDRVWPIIRWVIDKVVAYYKLLWKVTSTVFGWIWRAVQGFVSFFRDKVWPVVRWVIDKVVAYYRMLWKVVSAVFGGIWRAVSAFVGFFRDKVWPIIRWVIDRAVAYYRMLWRAVSAVFRAIWNVIGGFAGFFRDKVWPIIRSVIDKVATYYKMLWRIVSAVFGGIWRAVSAFVGFFRDKVWPVIRWVIDKVAAAYKALWRIVSAVFRAIWNVIQWFVSFFRDKVWPVIRSIIDKVAAAYRWLAGSIAAVFRTVWGAIGGFTGFFRDRVWPVIRWVIDKIKLGFQTMWNTVAGVWDAVWSKVAWARDKLYGAAMAIKGFFTGIWDGIKDAAQAAFNWVRDVWNRTLGGKGFTIPGTSVDFRIPMLAAGGIVTRPTLALVGEAGPEAVIPLGRDSGIRSFGGSGTRGDSGAPGGDVHIHVNGTIFGSKEQVARTVVDALNDAQNRGLRLNIRAS